MNNCFCHLLPRFSACVPGAMDYLSVHLLDWQIEMKWVKCCLNIFKYYCHGREDECYASLLFIKLEYHTHMIAEIQQNNESFENMRPCESIAVRWKCFLI